MLRPGDRGRRGGERRVACWPKAGAAFALVLATGATAVRADDAAVTLVRGVVRAEAAATVSSELIARVAALPFKPGQSFRAGDVLLKFDCRRYEADLRAAEAEVKMQQITVETNQHLLRHRATGANDLALAEAKLAQASAAADAMRVRASQCVIAAPYDGRIVDRSVDVFEMPQANAALMKIVRDGTLEIDVIVPSKWAPWLQRAQEFSFAVEETGSTHRCRVLHIGAVVDPVSRTMKVTAQLLDPGPLVRPGMSGAAQMRPPIPEAK